MIKKQLLAILCLASAGLAAQVKNYWQQAVKYDMTIDFDVKNHQFNGQQNLTYTNNSPDTLRKVYYHLYFNAFQPGSGMDMRSLNITDPDKRVGDRISKLKEKEIGFQKIESLSMNGEETQFEVIGTVLKVTLPKAIPPHESVQFEMTFNGQVPIQIRRSGRDNKEKIAYSMSQWYPKMAAYDREGWHADQYIGREFYADFGSFDVKINIHKDYKLGGTGTLVNAEEIGWGYTDESDLIETKNKTRTWHFHANNVHDFAWAADKKFKHTTAQVPNGPLLHFLYTPTAFEENWQKLPEYAIPFFQIMEKNFGKYPYPQFSVIQAGDGGMEYPMCTFMLGSGEDFEGFAGLFVHESAHNWYYGVIASNETNYPWMDEGFTTFAEETAMNQLFNKGHENLFPNVGRLTNFMNQKDVWEPLITPGDHYNRNMSYGINSYRLGSGFVNQLKYVIGEEAFSRGMKDYWNTWQFKHPQPKDFIRVMELASDMELDWYLNYYGNMTKPLDYKVEDVKKGAEKGQTQILLAKEGNAPMPQDVWVTKTSGEVIKFHIPIVMTYGSKPGDFITLAPWQWTNPNYAITIDMPLSDIQKIEIDPLQYTWDVNIENNTYTIE